ncbi:MAG: RagB/SusD family nutrient uptake outer membrane protein [Prevotellaceae bacterium]|jgi:hypothetical protein|nr:RagB/SusD family nutrient uptake outer membrane protein [Prevotellaceae bacterium]
MKKYLKKYLRYPVVAGIMCVALPSCEDAFGDFLEKQPSNELTEKQVFSDWTTTMQLHFDTYNFLRNGACRINNSWMDAATDLAETSYASGGVRTTFNIGNYYGAAGASELIDTWEHYYRGIRKCNMLLTRIDSVPKGADLSDEKYETDKLNYKSEARFLRAYFYWELFLRYGAIPIVKDVLDPNGDLLTGYTNRPTVKSFVVDFVLQELQACESGLMPYDDGVKPANAGRISQPMARALYSRIMLYMASERFSAASGITWEQAAGAAKSFIDDFGSSYELFTVTEASGTNGVAAYTNAILRTTYEGNNKEVIFFRNDVQVGWSNIRNDTPVGEGGNGGLCPSQNLVDMYDMKDGASPFAQYDKTGSPVYSSGVSAPAVNSASGYDDASPWSNRDPRLAATVLHHGASWGNGVINVIKGQRDNPTGNANATPTGYYLRKYVPENILSTVHTGTSYRNWIIIRYAEILLSYAEAMNEASGPGGEVYAYLNQIRHRAGITGNVEDRSDLTSSKDNMRSFIRKERTVELAFEDHRAWDVRRWNVAVEALARPVYGVDVTSSACTRKVAQERVFEEKMYLYPIPEAEVWKANIENNPGW